jgi:hypothetical protein
MFVRVFEALRWSFGALESFEVVVVQTNQQGLSEFFTHPPNLSQNTPKTALFAAL